MEHSASSVNDPAHALAKPRHRTQTRVAVDAPDIVVGSDLADRLRAYGPLLSSNGDGCRLTIPDAGPDRLRTVLATAQEWARHWELHEAQVRVGGRSFTLDSHRKPQAAPQRPKLLFFYSPRSGQCRRAEALVAQVLQRRHNHETFDLVRVSVDARPELAEQFGVDEIPTVVVLDGRRVAARLVSPRHSQGIESALHPWLR